MIWIIGGTKDSREILQQLVEKTKKDIIITTATEYGGKLIENYLKLEDRKIEVISERLNDEEMKKLINEKNIDLVIDASHPYAQNVSRSVINVTTDLGINYIRFERKMLNYGKENIEKFENIEEMKEYLNKFENKKILSTLGSNNLNEIKDIQEKNELYVRILPTTASIKKAEELGYLPSKIIAIQGPIDKILNKAMLKSFKIDFLITKESGATGGELEKVEACTELGVTVLVIKRPYVNYGIVYNEIEELMNDNKILEKQR